MNVFDLNIGHQAKFSLIKPAIADDSASALRITVMPVHPSVITSGKTERCSLRLPVAYDGAD